MALLIDDSELELEPLWGPVSAVAGYFPNLPPTTPPSNAPVNLVAIALFGRRRRSAQSQITDGPDEHIGVDRPVNGQKRCAKCMKVLDWPLAFKRDDRNPPRKCCTDCLDKRAITRR